MSSGVETRSIRVGVDSGAVSEGCSREYARDRIVGEHEDMTWDTVLLVDPGERFLAAWNGVQPKGPTPDPVHPRLSSMVRWLCLPTATAVTAQILTRLDEIKRKQ